MFPLCFLPAQVIDVGSGKGYLSSFLSLQYGLRVFGIDSSNTNTHGAQERNRKLKKYSRVYQKHSKAARAQRVSDSPQEDGAENNGGDGAETVVEEKEEVFASLPDINLAVERHSESHQETDDLFLNALSLDVIQTTPPRVPCSQLSAEERERRKRENLERKAKSRAECTPSVFQPLTSYVTAETELRELIDELEVRKFKS